MPMRSVCRQMRTAVIGINVHDRVEPMENIILLRFVLTKVKYQIVKQVYK